MNTQNADFLKRSLLNLGFGEQLNTELDRQLSGAGPEFKLAARNEYNGQAVNYTLHFKAGEQPGMYFFNKYDAAFQKGKAPEQSQTFYINKGHGVTAKEAFNLMEGRAVYKQLSNKEQQKYQTWIKLDPKDLTEAGNKRIKQYSFDLEKFLEGKGIKQMEGQTGREDLIRSLKKGNQQMIQVNKEGTDQKYFIAANPQFKTVDLYDSQLKRLHREELFPAGTKTDQKKDQAQEQTQPKEKSVKQAEKPIKDKPTKRSKVAV